MICISIVHTKLELYHLNPTNEKNSRNIKGLLINKNFI